MKERDFYIKHLDRTLIGPGANAGIFGFDTNTELLNSHPLQMYYSGILFPEIKSSENSEKQCISSIEDQNSQSGFIEKEVFENDTNSTEPVSTNDQFNGKIKEENENKESIEVNSYFPTNIGLTFCIDKDVNKLKVTFTAGKYIDVFNKDKKAIKIKIDKNDFDKLKNTSSEYHFEFYENIEYEPINDKHGWMYISKEISDNVKATKNKISNYKRKLKELDFPNPYDDTILKKFDLITGGHYYKRIELFESLEIDLNQKKFTVFKDDSGKEIAVCYIKEYFENDRKYVKLLLANTFDKHPRNEFSFGKEKLNQKCLFQTKIQVHANLLPYKDKLIENKYDDEATLINYQYREHKFYGIGHGCAVQWSKSENNNAHPNMIETTFLPQVKVRSVSNNFRHENQHLKEIAKVKNLTVWTEFSRELICDKLTEFVNAYSNWIESQKQKSQSENQFKEIANDIIKNQEYNRNRLLKNIDLLRNNPEIYDTFILANTAMYIQMIISRDEQFSSKEKELADFEHLFKNNKDLNYKSFDFFKNYTPDKPIIYYPFQLSFLLLNIESITVINSDDRNNLVDLLWFPTGGGKTEAYLAVTALTILWRRIKNPDNFEGVSVIMRYTLRLLTAQQFERASRLILALEFMNRKQNEIPTNALISKNINIGNSKIPISIGMWVGGATTPNKIEDAKYELKPTQKDGKLIYDPKTLVGKVKQINEKPEDYKNADKVTNIFQLSSCPWCGCKTITKNPETGKFIYAFRIDKEFEIECLNKYCEFKNKIPVDVVDDSLYNQPPTLLFATVDKFAQLSHREEGHKFFNSLNEKLPPDLIIQDELHLLNGPLGSIVGLFELMVEYLSTKGNSRPKIIASTATTRNTNKQVQNLYGNRTVNIFPPQGITYDDNYFSFTDNEKTGQRLHVGFMPTGKTSVDTQVRALLPNILFARILLYKELKKDKSAIDNYWTIVSYYNSLKDVGKIYNKVNDEILSELKRLHEQFIEGNKTDYNFNHFGLIHRTKELTSRIESTKVKNTLNELSNKFEIVKEPNKNYWTVKDTVDLVLASNMFSVGIDISRLNVMLMNGQPKNIAEYIQASSRVARKFEGVVINLLDANRAREKSYFEHYLPFHEAYYKYVEPLTVTPFTDITFEKVLNSILVCYVRHKKGLYKNDSAHDFKGDIEELKLLIKDRITIDETEIFPNAIKYLEKLKNEWLSRIKTIEQQNAGKQENEKVKLKYKNDLITQSTKQDDWSLMNSMREVDTNSLIITNLNSLINEQEENIQEE